MGVEVKKDTSAFKSSSICLTFGLQTEQREEQRNRNMSLMLMEFFWLFYSCFLIDVLHH